MLGPVGKTQMRKASSALAQKAKAGKAGRAKRWEGRRRRSAKEQPLLTPIFLSRAENLSGLEEDRV